LGYLEDADAAPTATVAADLDNVLARVDNPGLATIQLREVDEP
jgi:hypothetical protein